MACRYCGGPFTVTASTFPRFDLLACADCGQAIGLIPRDTYRVPTYRARRGDEARTLRAARRARR